MKAYVYITSICILNFLFDNSRLVLSNIEFFINNELLVFVLIALSTSTKTFIYNNYEVKSRGIVKGT